MYPPPLQSLIEHFDFEQVRKDAECSDTVGIHVRREPDGRMHFAVSLGCGVQTLTKALTTVLCRGLNGATMEEVLNVPEDFIARIIGEELVRIRSRTVYYVLKRMKEATGALQAGSVGHMDSVFPSPPTATSP